MCLIAYEENHPESSIYKRYTIMQCNIIRFANDTFGEPSTHQALDTNNNMVFLPSITFMRWKVE